MKVMHVLNSRIFTGAETVVGQIVHSFRDEPDMEMVYCSPESDIVRQALLERGIPYLLLDSLTPGQLREVIRREKPDIIHAHDMRAGFVSALCCGRIPLISHIHNNAFDARGLSVKSVAYLLAAWRAKHILWVSDNSYEGYFFHKWFAKKSSVLRNIIDTREIFRKRDADPNTYDFDMIFLGRLSYPKDPRRLMQVAAMVKQRKPDLKVAVVGAGELEEETKALCAQLDLQDNVQFLGFQSNPMKMLSCSRVLILTSRWEGIPMCALEAMALGVPVVSTPVGDMKALVESGVSGYLCQEDEALADAVTSLLTDREHWQQISACTLEKFATFNDEPNYRRAVAQVYGYRSKV